MMIGQVLTFLVVVLFLIHEFEEMIMVAPWVRRQMRMESSRARNHYFVHRFADASQAVVVFMIGIEFLILAAVALFVLITGWYALMIGFLVPYSLHLIGHISEWFIYRSYTPSLLTSVVTLPLCVATAWGLYVASDSSILEVALSALVMTVLFAVNFAMINVVEPKSIEWFRQYEAPEHA